jgi:hypothetical protein
MTVVAVICFPVSLEMPVAPVGWTAMTVLALIQFNVVAIHSGIPVGVALNWKGFHLKTVEPATAVNGSVWVMTICSALAMTAKSH